MEIILREGQKSDMSAVLLLIEELASFEKEANAVEVSVEDLERDGFGEKPLFKVFIAERNNFCFHLVCLICFKQHRLF